MVSRIIQIILRALAVILLGGFCAYAGFVAGSMVFAIFGFEINGREGYEAGGPLGFILGGLIGLIASAVFLFRKRSGK